MSTLLEQLPVPEGGELRQTCLVQEFFHLGYLIASISRKALSCIGFISLSVRKQRRFHPADSVLSKPNVVFFSILSFTSVEVLVLINLIATR